MSLPATNGVHADVRFLPLAYDGHNSHESAMRLILTLMPHWAGQDGKGDGYIDFVRFTDGITNTLLKAVNRRPGLSKSEIDRDAVLLRAYGNGTAVLIDREREAANHELLMKHNLAPALLARFRNGMMYRFVPGTPALPQDLANPPILKAIARRLAEWHATVPCLLDTKSDADEDEIAKGHSNGSANGSNGHAHSIAPGQPRPNVWSTMQKWILALPTDTQSQRDKQSLLQTELEKLSKQLSQRPGLGRDGLVFSHCDLLCANVIIQGDSGPETTVSFIDYEYGTPSPAAFDIANHFAEWVGYDCDYALVPTKSQRETFIREYIATYKKLTESTINDEEEEVRKLIHEVDVFRGVPGFYWGIWASIQAMISEIDFNYATYSDLRLSEYWAWRAEEDGSRAAAGKEMPLREKTWSRAE